MSLWRPYTQWYPYFEHNILGMFEANCSKAMATPKTVDRWCQIGAQCIFNHIDSYTQTEMAGAAVMLGLAPATLAVVGPSDQSLAFLSLERPVLSLLLASSTATLSVGYPFSRDSPLKPLAEALETVWSVDDLLPWKPRPALTSALQYLLAAAATVNTIQMSVDITNKTIVSWSCPNWAWVLCWSLVPLFLHMMGMVFYRLTVQREPRPRDTLGAVRGGQPARPSALARAWEWALDSELRPCSQRVLPTYTIRYSLLSQVLWWTPRVGAYLSYIMGTAIFSSLLFVPISDAFPIIVRYAVSSMLSRCILGLELQSLKNLNKPSDAAGVASPRFENKFTGFDFSARSVTVNAEVIKER